MPSLAAGAGLALSLPPWGWWVLAFPAAGLLWWRLGGLRLRARLLAGWATGLGLFVPGLWWATTFNTYGGAVLMAVESLFPLLACAAVPRRARGRTVVLAGAMVLVEALRDTWPFGGLPMGGVALGQAAGPLAGAARVGGPLLLVGLVWLGGAGVAILAEEVLRWVGRARANRRLAASEADRQPGTPARRHAPEESPSTYPPGTGWWGTTAAPETPPEPAGATPPPGRRVQAPAPAPAPATASLRARRHDVRTGTTFGAPTAAPPRGPAARPVLAAVVAMAAVAGIGAWGTSAPDGGPALRTVRVAAVQGGGVRGLRKADVDPAVVYAAQLAASAEIPGRDGGRAPSLVVWPEDVVSLDTPLDGSQAEKDLSGLAVRLHTTLEAGVTETVRGRRFLNEVVAFAPSGALVGRFEKVHRVPFGEYVPYRWFFKHLADLSGVPLDAVPGHGNGVLHTPAGPLGTMVSYEVFYAQRGRITTRAGAQLLTDPTNTSSYLTSQVPTQEVAAARLQAIAEGRDLVQAAPTGFSALVDHTGRVVARSALAERAVIIGDVSLRSGRTLYERAGDLPVLVVSGLFVLGGWLATLGSDPDPDLTRAARRERRARDGRRAQRAVGP